MIVDKYHSHCREYDEEIQPVGVKNEFKVVSSFLISFLDHFCNNKLVESRIIYISGEYGIGKSCFVKSILRNIDGL